jgi:hypothetical protein
VAAEVSHRERELEAAVEESEICAGGKAILMINAGSLKIFRPVESHSPMRADEQFRLE